MRAVETLATPLGVQWHYWESNQGNQGSSGNQKNIIQGHRLDMGNRHTQQKNIK